MARIKESADILQHIHDKAIKNAKQLGTYQTKSEFSLGRPVLSFTELCNRSRKRVYS